MTLSRTTTSLETCREGESKRYRRCDKVLKPSHIIKSYKNDLNTQTRKDHVSTESVTKTKLLLVLNKLRHLYTLVYLI